MEGSRIMLFIADIPAERADGRGFQWGIAHPRALARDLSQ